MEFFDDVPYRDPYGRRRGGPWDSPVDEFPSAVATGPLVLAQTEEGRGGGHGGVGISGGV